MLYCSCLKWPIWSMDIVEPQLTLNVTGLPTLNSSSPHKYECVFGDLGSRDAVQLAGDSALVQCPTPVEIPPFRGGKHVLLRLSTHDTHIGIKWLHLSMLSIAFSINCLSRPVEKACHRSPVMLQAGLFINMTEGQFAKDTWHLGEGVWNSSLIQACWTECFSFRARILSKGLGIPLPSPFLRVPLIQRAILAYICCQIAHPVHPKWLAKKCATTR